MTRTHAPATAKRFAHLIDTATVQAQTLALAADTLRALLPTLSPLGQETIRQQLERIERDERDMWDEVDFQITEAIQAGYGPEDMEN